MPPEPLQDVALQLRLGAREDAAAARKVGGALGLALVYSDGHAGPVRLGVALRDVLGLRELVDVRVPRVGLVPRVEPRVICDRRLRGALSSVREEAMMRVLGRRRRAGRPVVACVESTSELGYR